jgi:hypothetical protein
MSVSLRLYFRVSSRWLHRATWRKAYSALVAVISLIGYAGTASAYSLLFGKWDDPTRGTGATIS